MTVLSPSGSVSAHVQQDKVRSLMLHARRIVVIARAELFFEVQSPAFWIALVLGGAITTTALLMAMPSVSSLMQTITILLSVFYPFVAMRVFSRDTVRRTLPLITTRPLIPAEYSFGKWIGMTIAAYLYQGSLVAIALFMNAIFFHTLTDPLETWLSLIPTFLIAVLLATAVTIICLRSIPIDAIGAMIASLIMLFMAQYYPVMLLSPRDYLAYTVFESPSIGLGPDLPLIQAGNLLHGMTALLLLSVVSLVSPLREKIIDRRPRQYIFAGIAIFLAAIITFGAYQNFQSVAQTDYLAIGPAPSAPVTATTTNYVLDYRVDPGSGSLSGEAHFTLTPDQHVSLHTLLILINPGLIVHRITIDGIAVKNISQHLGWIILDTSTTELAAGNAASFAMTYAGHIIVTRQDYTPFESGGSQINFSFRDQGFIPTSPITAYAGQNMTFFTNAGNWYPRPWTAQTVQTYYADQTLTSMSVHFPSADVALTGQATQSYDGNGNVLTIGADALRYSFALAIIAQPRHTTCGKATVFYRGSLTTLQKTLCTDIVQQISALDATFHSQHRAVQIVIAPFVGTPVINHDFVLIPDFQSSSASITYPLNAIDAQQFNDHALYRYLATITARSWIHSQFSVSQTVDSNAPTILNQNPNSLGKFELGHSLFNDYTNYQPYSPNYYIPAATTTIPPNQLGVSPQLPNGEMTMTTVDQHEMTTSLPAILGAIITDRAIPGYLDQEIQIRSQVAGITNQQNQQLRQGKSFVPSFTIADSVIYDKFYHLGLNSMINSPIGAQWYFALGQTIGFDRLATLLQSYLTAHQYSEISLPDLIASWQPQISTPILPIIWQNSLT